MVDTIRELFHCLHGAFHDWRNLVGSMDRPGAGIISFSMKRCCQCGKAIEEGTVCEKCKYREVCPACGSFSTYNGVCLNIECNSNDVRYMKTDGDGGITTPTD